MNRRTLTLSALLVAGAMTAGRAAEPDGDWKFELAPYAFGASMDGSMTIKGHTADVDISRSDIFDHMDNAGMAMFSARRGNWGIGADAIYVDLGVDSPMGSVEPRLGIVSVVGLRKVASFADVTFGAQWTHLEASLDLVAPVPVSVDKSRDWVDPTVGVILKSPTWHRLHANLVASVGGFGLGSDLTWQAVPTVGVDLAKWVSLDFGWRWLDTDYSTGSGADKFEYDILLQGPVAGVTFKW